MGRGKIADNKGETMSDVYQTVVVYRGLVIGKTYLGTRLLASPRAHRILSRTRMTSRLLRNRYLGRSGVMRDPLLHRLKAAEAENARLTAMRNQDREVVEILASMRDRLQAQFDAVKVWEESADIPGTGDLRAILETTTPVLCDEYTPTTEQVREGFATDPVAEYNDPITNHTAQGRRVFDRWLAAHDAEVAATARRGALEEAARGTPNARGTNDD